MLEDCINENTFELGHNAMTELGWMFCVVINERCSHRITMVLLRVRKLIVTTKYLTL